MWIEKMVHLVKIHEAEITARNIDRIFTELRRLIKYLPHRTTLKYILNYTTIVVLIIVVKITAIT